MILILFPLPSVILSGHWDVNTPVNRMYKYFDRGSCHKKYDCKLSWVWCYGSTIRSQVISVGVWCYGSTIRSQVISVGGVTCRTPISIQHPYSGWPSCMKDISDWILFYQRFFHLLGDMYRFVLYRVNLVMSPKDDWDTECNRLPSVGTTDLTTDSGYGPDEILCPDGSWWLSPVCLFIYERPNRGWHSVTVWTLLGFRR
jgi:hypothetical protein